MVERVEPDAPTEPTGLIDDVKSEAEGKVENSSEEETTVNHRVEDSGDSPDPKIDAGAEERPEFIPEKFWKDGKTDTESLAKGYAELETKMRAGKHKAPEDGKYDGKFLDGKIPADDPMLTEFNKMALEKGISQGDYEDLIGLVLQNGANVEQQAIFDKDAEMKILGPNAEKIIDEQVEWARTLVKAKYWGEDDFEEFKIFAGTAGGVKALMQMRRYYGDTTTIPTDIMPTDEALPSKDDCYQMVNDPKYQTDPAYRAKVEKTFAKVFGTEPDHRVAH